jgi:hypothetical protein
MVRYQGVATLTSSLLAWHLVVRQEAAICAASASLKLTLEVVSAQENIMPPLLLCLLGTALRPSKRQN